MCIYLSMATNSVTLRCLLVAAIIFIATATELKETQMSLYFQHWGVSAGPNATSIPVGGIPGKPWSGSQFGTIYVHDDPITEGPDPNSVTVGRSQGMHVIASSDGTHSLIMFSIAFSNQAYNGSTLQIYGTGKHYEPAREVSVVAGTGKFRFARGYATLETYFSYIPTSYVVIRCNISMLHY